MSVSLFRNFAAALVFGAGLLLAGGPAGASLVAADGPRSTAYRDGQRALAEERWSDALAAFTALADAKSGETDAALYWQAWTESKLGRRADALATLRKLVAEHPKSDWVDDAQVLELELKGPRATASGARVGGGGSAGAGSGTARADGDDDLKLYALDGLMQVEPERAVPILERFLAGDHSPRLKERALFVLAQSDTPRAREILIDVARRGEPPYLRVKAIESLGIAGDADDLAALEAIWKGANPELKRKILEAWMIAGAKSQVLEVARSDGDRGIRRKAIEMLGVMNATAELGQLYSSETDHEVRAKLLEAYGIAGDVAALARAARSEGDLQLRRKAIEGLGVFGGGEGSRELVSLYGVERERALRSKIVESLMINGDAQALVGLFRKEQDPAMKRDILQKISLLDDAAVTELLGEVLEDRP